MVLPKSILAVALRCAVVVSSPSGEWDGSATVLVDIENLSTHWHLNKQAFANTGATSLALGQLDTRYASDQVLSDVLVTKAQYSVVLALESNNVSAALASAASIPVYSSQAIRNR
ncbi:hypothetical protein C7212DRAFT_342537 [Tuber magnatum]|uniref:Uncharacterized protein n=1 Tax=Tuber magnatum TaxID=42249 RepID=A0A317SU47_9PEZI|nr:hypothetical protein C7212DRAFT_342537 [Tuber magnatum]